MFEAYSQSKHRIVNVKDEFDLNEVFLCPNPQCSAKLTLRSVNGKRAKHFGRLKSSPHCGDCPYDHSQQSYINGEHVVKYPLEAIFNGVSGRKESDNYDQRKKSDRPSLSDTKQNFVRTPKQLYYFCISNALDTPYTDTLTVGDIVLDNRNLQHNANFRGISGLRLVIAETVRYDKDDKYLQLVLHQRTVHNKNLKTKVFVYMEDELIREVNKYLFDTYKSFPKHHIAVLGIWTIRENHEISCTLKNKSHLIFRL